MKSEIKKVNQFINGRVVALRIVGADFPTLVPRILVLGLETLQIPYKGQELTDENVVKGIRTGLFQLEKMSDEDLNQVINEWCA